MGNPLISIIVPVYNVEKYINKCVESIIAQTYGNLEIILVDDGSTDNCSEMCDEWARKDPRIRVIHKKNGGASAARNSGLDVAKGDYIGFVDSDDYIEENMYEELLCALKESDKKISCCYSFVVYDDEEVKKIQNKSNNKVLDCVETLNAVFAFKIGTSFWRRLFHRTVFDYIRFPEGQINEEYSMIIPTTVISGGVVLVQKQLYYYRDREGSVTDTVHLSYSNSKCVYKNLHIMKKQIIENNLPCMKAFGFFAARNSYQMVLTLEKNYTHFDACLKNIYAEYIKIVRENWFSFLGSTHSTLKEKILYLLILSDLFRLIYNVLNRE